MNRETLELLFVSKDYFQLSFWMSAKLYFFIVTIGYIMNTRSLESGGIEFDSLQVISRVMASFLGVGLLIDVLRLIRL